MKKKAKLKLSMTKWGVVILAIVLADFSYAVDLKGKLGMGARWWGVPFIALATTRYGFTSKFSAEPVLGYYRWHDEYTSGDTSHTSSSEDKYSLLLVGGLGNFSVRANAKGNVYIRIGGLLATGNRSYSSNGHKRSGEMRGYGALVGYGLEHFVSEHFAISVGMLSCWWMYTDEYVRDAFTSKSSISGLIFGNQLLDFAVMWYY